MHKDFLKKRQRYQNGFTLIELIIVIAIITLLSAIVLTSLSTSRDRSKDTAIIQSVVEYRKLLELEKQDTGSYYGLMMRYEFSNPSSCDWNLNFATGRGGNEASNSKYKENAASICRKITELSGGVAPNGFNVYIWEVYATNPKSAYSIAVWLPGRKAYYCINEGGATSFTPVLATSNDAGCLFDGNN